MLRLRGRGWRFWLRWPLQLLGLLSLVTGASGRSILHALWPHWGESLRGDTGRWVLVLVGLGLIAVANIGPLRRKPRIPRESQRSSPPSHSPERKPALLPPVPKVSTHSAIAATFARAIAAADLARPLIDEGQALLTELWETRLRMKRASKGFPLDVLPGTFLKKAKAWHGRVEKLVDEALPAKDAGDVDPFPTLLGGLTPSKEVANLIESDLTALRLIERQGRRK